MLTSLGEKLNDDEVDELLKGVNVGKDDSVNYGGIPLVNRTNNSAEFVQMILAN